MHDHPDHASGPRTWGAAFAALPRETPPPGGWDAIAARLETRRRPRWVPWTAVAAVLLLAVALPWRLQMPGDDLAGAHGTAQVLPSPPAAAPDRAGMAALQAESAQLETLLPLIRDARMSSGTAAMLAGELEHRLALIDVALAQPDLPPERALDLWRARVDTLHTLAGLEGTRRWMAVNGDHYDPALVRVY